MLMLAVSCGDSAVDELQPFTVPLPDIAAMSQLATGEIVAGDRKTGTIYKFSLVDPEPLTIGRLPVSSDGQRGLLGLTVLDGDRIFVAWTRPDEQLVVAEIPAGPDESGEPAEPRLVWSGFVSSTGANGGHLELLPDGRLVLGVGTLRRSALIDDPDVVNGKMLAIEPDGDPDQVPEILSSGWKNPFAFVVTDVGELWVADNEPEDGSSERIGRGDTPDAPLVDVVDQLAPSALIELGPKKLGVCSFITGELRSISLFDDGFGSGQPGPALASGCRTAALVIDDDWILLSDQESLQLQRLSDR